MSPLLRTGTEKVSVSPMMALKPTLGLSVRVPLPRWRCTVTASDRVTKSIS